MGDFKKELLFSAYSFEFFVNFQNGLKHVIDWSSLILFCLLKEPFRVKRQYNVMINPFFNPCYSFI